MRTFALWVGLFIFSATAHIVAGKWWNDVSPLDTAGEAGRVAFSLATTGTFANPWPILPTGPTAHVAPAYPFILSELILLFGTGHTGWWAIRILTIAVFTLQWALLPWVASVWGLSRRIGYIAAGIGVLMPIPGIFFKWEAIFVALALVLLAGLTGLVVSRPFSNLLWCLLAVGWGIALLFSPAVLLVGLAWSLIAVYLLRKTITVKKMAVLAFVPLLIITPWIARNYRAFHHIFLLRDNMGQTLAFSNNDCTTGWVKKDLSSGCLTRMNPYDTLEVAERVVREGEYQFNQDYLHDGTSWIGRNPGKFLSLTALRVRYFWFPPADSEEGWLASLNIWMICVLTALSVPGLYFIYARRRETAILLLSALLLYPAVYYLAQLDLRYRYPILWITVFSAAAALYEVASRWAGKPAGD